MQTVPFYKMSGAGNDFIVIDNRNAVVPDMDLPGFAANICRRKYSVGADGLFLLEASERADFKWRFFNADGSIAEMCGNGARCVSRFAVLTGMTGEELSFETLAGIIHARVSGDQVRIKMTDPHSLGIDKEIAFDNGKATYGFINTGVPHVVIEVDDIERVDVAAVGREIRNHADFAPAGTNVNFVVRGKDGTLGIRTYERGVEDETLACGTGNVAAALVFSERYGLSSPVTLKTRSGFLLKVHFQKSGDTWQAVYLEGDARVIYKGELTQEAWQY